VGLGSTSTVMIAVATAMNEALGSPLHHPAPAPDRHNYVEETADGKIAFGFETGVGPAVSVYGGMAIMATNSPSPTTTRLQKARTSTSSFPDRHILGRDTGVRPPDEQGPHPRLPDRELKAYLFLMDLIPAWRGRSQEAGDVIWRSSSGARSGPRWSTIVSRSTII